MFKLLLIDSFPVLQFLLLPVLHWRHLLLPTPHGHLGIVTAHLSMRPAREQLDVIISDNRTDQIGYHHQRPQYPGQ
jgi:hypothetical protein